MNNISCNPIPDIIFFENNGNPTLRSPNTPYEISFNQTRASLNDPELYEDFLKNIISRFRKSKTYKNYKSFLYDIGLDHSQVHGNISSEMASLEMHHNILTVFDIAFVITEWYLNTTGYVNTFDVITVLKRVHTNHMVSLIMLDETTHQAYHGDPMFYIDPKMCTPGWFQFLTQFKEGITKSIAFKIINYMDEAMNHDTTCDNGLLDVRQHILDWSNNNQYAYYS
jgi:hypothetical protein